MLSLKQKGHEPNIEIFCQKCKHSTSTQTVKLIISYVMKNKALHLKQMQNKSILTGDLKFLVPKEDRKGSFFFAIVAKCLLIGPMLGLCKFICVPQVQVSWSGCVPVFFDWTGIRHGSGGGAAVQDCPMG